ncbi:4a-hydroxytetrahydrobiopterin dehydratase [Aeromonas veronii]|uniref:4a-hydroxytetrahydrobiopterin dehydratase n=1 Tax=Aeromonas veronii TaxID=654 RepID=UPI0035B92CEA|nr:hypothetical protein CF135_04290 [Aeromonas veronii]
MRRSIPLPAFLTEWGKVTVSWWMHKIGGLHRNDFIMAARTDQLLRSSHPTPASSVDPGLPAKAGRARIFMGWRSHWGDRDCIIRSFIELARKCVPNAS